MDMTQEHKDALAQGRRESKAIKAYLEALDAPKRRGRPVTAESLQMKIADLDGKIRDESDPLRRVELIQARLDTEEALAGFEATENIDALEAGFVDYGNVYSERKGISYAAWREVGVPAPVLKQAGIKRTRRS
ncbi:MAG: hypothetical protein U9O63_08115 [Actinomycetota bacterium]|nr:hypothetical protein [Actinomycetota bacterium]